MQVFNGLGNGTKKIDIDKVSENVANITKNMQNCFLAPLTQSMRYTTNLIDSGTWESPAKDKLCNGLMGMLLDNYSSIESSIGNLNNYIAIIISNYNQMEQDSINMFKNLF